VGLAAEAVAEHLSKVGNEKRMSGIHGFRHPEVRPEVSAGLIIITLSKVG